MGQRPSNEVSLPLGAISALQTNATSSDTVASPIDGELVGVAFFSSVLIDAALTLDVVHGSNGTIANLGALLVPSPTQPAFTGVILVPTTKVFVAEGDSIRVETNGQQMAAGTGTLTAIIRP